MPDRDPVGVWLSGCQDELGGTARSGVCSDIDIQTVVLFLGARGACFKLIRTPTGPSPCTARHQRHAEDWSVVWCYPGSAEVPSQNASERLCRRAVPSQHDSFSLWFSSQVEKEGSSGCTAAGVQLGQERYAWVSCHDFSSVRLSCACSLGMSVPGPVHTQQTDGPWCPGRISVRPTSGVQFSPTAI